MARVRGPSRREVHQPHRRRAGIGRGHGLPGAIYGHVQEQAAERLGGAVQGEGDLVLRQPYSVR